MGLKAAGARPRARGVRAKHLALSLALVADSIPSTPLLQYSNLAIGRPGGIRTPITRIWSPVL